MELETRLKEELRSAEMYLARCELNLEVAQDIVANCKRRLESLGTGVDE